MFVLTDNDDQVRYIGYSSGNGIIETIANAIEKGKDEGCTMFKVLYTKSYNEARVVANMLISRYSPVNNLKSETRNINIQTGFNNTYL